MLRQVWFIGRKDIQYMLRERETLGWMFVMPVVFFFFIGTVTSNFGSRGVILSGGPESVTDEQPPRAPQAVFGLGVPVLGICYGMQTMA